MLAWQCYQAFQRGKQKLTANNFKKYRELTNLSQAEVAKRLNTSRQSISKWENGKVNPGTTNLKALSEVYGVSMDVLIGTKNEMKQTAKIEPTRSVRTDTGAMYLLIALVAFLGGPIGVVVEGVLLYKNRVKNSFRKTIYVVATIGLLAGGYNTYTIVNAFVLHHDKNTEISIFI